VDEDGNTIQAGAAAITGNDGISNITSTYPNSKASPSDIAALLQANQPCPSLPSLCSDVLLSLPRLQFLS